MVEPKGSPLFISERQQVYAAADVRPTQPAPRQVRSTEQGARESVDHHPGYLFRHTVSNEPILGANKITYAHFVKTVWALANTNLHIKDFEVHFADELTRMFHPVRVKNGSGA